MSALVWAGVALTGLGLAYDIARRWVSRTTDAEEAVGRMRFEVDELAAWRNTVETLGEVPERKLAELSDRVARIELDRGLAS